jgi:hypothetical protein
VASEFSGLLIGYLSLGAGTAAFAYCLGETLSVMTSV